MQERSELSEPQLWIPNFTVSSGKCRGFECLQFNMHHRSRPHDATEQHHAGQSLQERLVSADTTSLTWI